MSEQVSDLQSLLSKMTPKLNSLSVAFVSLVEPSVAFATLNNESIISTFRESEGTTLIVELRAAEQAGLPILFRAAWITLTVHSDLEAVGLTAAFARVLGNAGISCNVVAAAFHDHIFVPIEKTQLAMKALHDLQIQASAEMGSS
jgi:uncharacterized protein